MRDPRRSNATGSRSTTAARPAKPANDAASTNGACRPSGSNPRNTPEIQTATIAPRPNSPRPRPRRPYGRVRDTRAAPTTNAAPATPVGAAAPATAGSEPASPRAATDTADTRLTAGII